ncbi:MAG: polyprenyl synthetase family protein [Deltaproteobacteria bacterium]|nr:polyprenyl synthetase family protein [Deltaproteobacteria bacterium]
MDLDKYLADRAALVNNALKEALAGHEERPKNLHTAMHYSLFAGGKRLRPILTLAACEASGGNKEDAINAACAMECIHTYSLIHDDLPALDNDDLRRGRPACHKVFGEALAILAGDALLTAAFEIMAKTPHPDKGVVVKAVYEAANAAGSLGMVGGQAVDIESEGTEVDFPALEYIHIHKTGKLIRASVRCGALIGGAGAEGFSALTRYGESVGLVFQIADDILDVEGSIKDMGKAVGGDAKKGKATYPSLMGVVESRRLANELVERAVSALSGFGDKAEPLRAIARFITERKK